MADSEREIFEQALKPEATPPPAVEVEEDDHEEPEPRAEQPSGEEQPRRPRAERIPLKDHLEEREKRQAAERERDTIRAEREAAARDLAETRRQLEELRRPKAEPTPIPDVLQDPDGYLRAVDQRFEQREQRLLGRMIDASFEDAKDANPAEFDKAFAAFDRRVLSDRDVQLRDKIFQAANPGKALLRWHRENEAVREIGGDLNAYKSRLLEEALKDPDFRKKADEAWRAEANGSATQGKRQTIAALPSLNRATGSGASNDADDVPMSDRELFQSVTRRPKRA